MADYSFVPVVTSPTTVKPRTIAIATSDTVTLEKGRTYTCWLKPKDTAGADYAGIVAIAAGSTPPAAASEAAADNKIPLRAGESVVLGPVETVYSFRVSAGTPILVILPGAHPRSREQY